MVQLCSDIEDISIERIYDFQEINETREIFWSENDTNYVATKIEIPESDLYKVDINQVIIPSAINVRELSLSLYVSDWSEEDSISIFWNGKKNKRRLLFRPN